MNNLDTIGLKGLILALGGVSGSVILAWVVYRFFFMRRDESSVSSVFLSRYFDSE